MLAYSKLEELKSELEHKLAVAEESVANTSKELALVQEKLQSKEGEP